MCRIPLSLQNSLNSGAKYSLVLSKYNLFNLLEVYRFYSIFIKALNLLKAIPLLDIRYPSNYLVQASKKVI